MEELEEENMRLKERIARLEEQQEHYEEDLERITRMADLDFLTGLANRNAIQQAVEVCLREEPDRPGALCFLDLDNFKQVNDRYGHSSGDQVLRVVARLIQDRLRDTDAVGRFGGDEFLVFMKDAATQEDIRKRLEEICGGIRDRRLTDRLTLSAGVACYPGDGRTFQELLDASDAALYVSKCAGKDQISFFTR